MLSFLRSGASWPYWLVPCIPAAIVMRLAHADPAALFFVSAAGVIPTAALMGEATEQLAARAGPGIGGLLNVTFGNAPEIIIALFALQRGLHEVVKASLVGSILGNVLLVMGGAMFVGGLRRERQHFDRTAASAQVTMLMLAVAALVMPAVYEMVQGQGLPNPHATRVRFEPTVENLSLAVAVVMMVVYAAGLIFSLRTHRALFNPIETAEGPDAEHWPVRRSVAMLALAGVAVAVMSEILVGSIEHAAEGVGLSQFFVGVIVVAIVGNAAEHWVAVVVAAKDKMDLAVGIAVGSSAQIALFAVPLLVLCSFVVGPYPLAFVLNGYELAAMVLAVVLASQVTSRGESNWFEGLQLLAVYAVIAIGFSIA